MDAVSRLAAVSTRTQSLLPGTVSLAQPILVDGAYLCVANIESASQPPLHRLQATAARLLSWEDRSLAAIYNPEAGCYDSSRGWSLAPADATDHSVPAACLAVACGSSALCESYGLSSDCSVLDPLNDLLNSTSTAASDLSIVALAAREAALTANATSIASSGLAASPAKLERLNLQAEYDVSIAQHQRSTAAWRAAAQRLLSTDTLASLRSERLDSLQAMIAAELPSIRPATPSCSRCARASSPSSSRARPTARSPSRRATATSRPTACKRRRSSTCRAATSF